MGQKKLTENEYHIYPKVTFCVPNLVAVRRACRKRGGTDRQRDRQTDRKRETAALYSRLLLFIYLCVMQYVASKIDFSFFLNNTSGGSCRNC